MLPLSGIFTTFVVELGRRTERNEWQLPMHQYLIINMIPYPTANN